MTRKPKTIKALTASTISAKLKKQYTDLKISNVRISHIFTDPAFQAEFIKWFKEFLDKTTKNVKN